MPNSFQSWGLYPKLNTQKAELNWQDQISSVANENKSYLACGLGRSYGDSCLLQGTDGILLSSSQNRHRILHFDQDTGIIEAEAGLSFDDLIQFALPRGFFPPVTPGTKYVTVGGAIANDVHGKNHHLEGTFAHHVLSFDLWRSDGQVLTCTPDQNSDFFAATVGGLGLTGLILKAKFQLKPVNSDLIFSETIPFSDLTDFFKISQESKDFEYTVAWIDTLARGKSLGRGLYMRGRHASLEESKGRKSKIHKQSLSVPFFFPNGVLNSTSVRVFNSLYYRKTLGRKKVGLQHYDPFFYPLDQVRNWNRIYGTTGFLQYQSVVPKSQAEDVTREMLKEVSQSGISSFLSVLKEFGNKPSLGLLSFAREGVTLAMDIPIKGKLSFELLDRLDQIVMSAGGGLYPAKDARMSSATFQKSYPRLQEFLKYKDPKFTSHFFQRTQKEQRNTQ